jgi:hypothetical protein
LLNRRSRPLPDKRVLSILTAAALCAGALLVIPGTASASSVNCRGNLAPDSDAPVPDVMKYQIVCDEAIQGYSLVTNRATDFFDTEPVVFIGNPDDGNASNESFSCEGFIPGNGVGCNGKSTPDGTGLRWEVGSLGFEADPCGKHAKGQGLKVWLTVVTTQLNAAGAPYTASSQPFRLGTHCNEAGRGRMGHGEARSTW